MQAPTPDQIIAGVKQIVAKEVDTLNPGVNIEYTDYFNHTYVPDMVLKFPGRGEECRPLYIRNSLRVSPIIEDVQTLEPRQPVMLGLRPADPESDEGVRSVARHTKRVLVTDIGSLDVFSQSLSQVNDAAAPLKGVLRANLLKSGRGMMTTSDIDDIQNVVQEVVSLDAETAASGISKLDQLTDNLYAEDGSLQIGRVGRIIQASVSPVLMRNLLSESGRLSDSDVRVILPYLLGRNEVATNEDLWVTVAELIDLEDVENVPEIEGVNLNRLLNLTALSRWTASRAELVFNNEFDVEALTEISELSRTEWAVRAGKLTATIGPWRIIFVSGDNRRLKGATDYPAVDWRDISTVANALIMESASLRGVTRRLTISAEESANVAQDVADVTATLEDSYRVHHLTVRLPASASPDSLIEVEFPKGLATVVRGPCVALGELGTIAIRLLGHRYPVEPDWLIGHESGA